MQQQERLVQLLFYYLIISFVMWKKKKKWSRCNGVKVETSRGWRGGAGKKSGPPSPCKTDAKPGDARLTRNTPLNLTTAYCILHTVFRVRLELSQLCNVTD